MYTITDIVTSVNILRTTESNKSCNMCNMTFITWLENELQERNWNRAELTRRTGLSTGLFSLIYNGQRKPGIKTCRAIAKALNIDDDIVLDQAGIRKLAKGIDPISKEMIYLFDKLPTLDREDELAELRLKVERRQKTGNERLSDNPRETDA